MPERLGPLQERVLYYVDAHSGCTLAQVTRALGHTDTAVRFALLALMRLERLYRQGRRYYAW